ncbi:MAG: alanine racemase [Lysinibacillus sp.]
METQKYFRPTKVIIDLNAIKNNIINMKKLLNRNTQIIAVVKANAYGHGDIEVAKAALEAGASILAVATPEEALRIRDHFTEVEILLLGASPISFAQYAAEQRISVTVFSAEWIRQLETLTKSWATPLKVHIKVDSGMGRIGVRSEEELLALHDAIQETGNVQLDGVFTHFATADDEDNEYFEKQVKLFKEIVAKLPEKPRLVHASNTATALVKKAELQFDAIRFGISMYGLSPSTYVESILPFELSPAFALETELVHIKRIKAGESIGYGATFVAPADMWVGTIPLGYADGVIRKLGGQDVLIDGKRTPIIGRICMDQCMLALPKAYAIGERVTLLGRQGQEEVRIEEWASKVETISYEVPCIITARVPRIYM